MNRQSIYIIAIIAVGSILSGLAYGVSNGAITVGDITITNTCTGCNKSPEFSSWATSLNQTIAGTSGNSNIGLLVGADGSILAQDSNSKTFIVTLTGTVVKVYTSPAGFINQGQVVISQSLDGKYKAILNSTSINIYKNNAFLKSLGINKAQWNGASLVDESVGISSDGKFIALSGKDTSTTIDRVIIFTGS